MARKLTYEEVRGRFDKKGYELVSKNYIDSNTHLEYICNKHKEKGVQEITIGNLRATGCYWCGLEKRSNKRKLSYDDVNKEFEYRGFRLLSKEYINSKTKLEFLCHKHGVQKVDWNHFKGSRGNGCPECGAEIRAKRKTTDLGIIQREFKNRGYNLISKSYSNGFKLKYICPDHKEVGIQEIAWSKFYNSNQGCPYCYGNIKKTTEQYKQEVYELVGDEYTVLGEYINALSKIKVKHNECGYIWDINASSFLCGRGCPRCTESKGESKVREYLLDNNINFTQEHTYDDLIGLGKGLLRFDFYLKDYNILVEYDGIQHFEPMRFENSIEDFKKTKKHDNIKNTYCIKNNIDLIRIPYWDFDNIEEILDEVLSNKDSAYFIA